MRAEELPELIERAKVTLFALVQGKTVPDDQHPLTDPEYRDLRQALRRHPRLASSLPSWLVKGSTLDEANRLIRDEAGELPGQWKRRKQLVSDGLTPLLDALQDDDATPLLGAAPGTLEGLDLTAPIGSGGFGTVYRCTHRYLKIPVALKVLEPSPHMGASQNVVARFFQEASMLLKLRHTNIVHVFDVGMLGPRPCMTMEYVDGVTLSKTSGMNPAAAARVVAALADALRHAHSLNVVHRDIRPGNVMIETATSRVVLLDFGLGVFVEDDITSRITKTGEAAAGGYYTAPELVSDPRLTDPRTDVYSLGAVWYQIVCGVPPAGTAVETNLSRSEVPKAQQSLLLRCLGEIQARPSADDVHLELTGQRPPMAVAEAGLRASQFASSENGAEVIRASAFAINTRTAG